MQQHKLRAVFVSKNLHTLQKVKATSNYVLDTEQITLMYRFFDSLLCASGLWIVTFLHDSCNVM